MSDASLPHCKACGRSEYACTCNDGKCTECSCKLNKVTGDAGGLAIKAGKSNVIEAVS